MSRELLEKTREIVKKAKALGAQGVRAGIGRTRDSQVEWRDGNLERITESTRMSLDLTLYLDGRYSSNSSSDLRPEAVDSLLGKTMAMTKALAKDPHRKLPESERYEDRFVGDLKLLDEKGIGSVTAVERRKTASALEEAARSAPGADQIISITGTCNDVVSDSAMVTSNGMEGTRRSSYFVLLADCTVKDEGDRKPEGWYYAVARYKRNLPSIETIGKEATRRALMGVGAKQEPSGEFPCVIENRILSRVLYGLLGPLSGRAIQQKRSFLADKVGKQIASPLLSITDDPHVIEGLGSRTYDGEGMSTRIMPIVEKGVLRDFYLDTYYASKLEKKPTTGSRTNLSFLSGDKDLDGLLREMGKGILVTGFSGGNSNSATGDFSIGIRGMWVEGGKPVRPVSEMNLAGNHLKVWHKLEELGNDPFMSSSIMSPSLRFGKLQFSGK